MKKLNYLLLGLTGLTLASCSQDEILEGATDGNCLITVSLPSDMATRAIGDEATAASLLNYAIFETDGTFIEKGTANFPEGEVTMTLPLNLTAGASYKIAFFAQDPVSTNVYSFNASDVAHSVTVEYGNMESALNNSDGYDCFYNLLETGAVGTDEMVSSVTLNRIVAQVNWGTSDFNKQTVINSYGSGLTNLKATLTTNAYGTFDLLTKEVSDEVPVTISDFTPDNSESFPVAGYDYIGMQYLLVPATSGVYNLDFEVANTEGTASTTINVANAPVQANYRTNIYGALLTDQYDFTVTLSPDWNTPDYTVADDFAALQKALNYSTPGSVVYLNNDMVIPSAIYISKTVELNLNGHTLTYAGKTGSAPFLVNSSNGNFTISGEGTVTTTSEVPLVWIYSGGTVNIKGGTFVDEYSHCVYIGGRNAGGGTANISGGSFKTTPADTWAINIYDADRSTSKFNVTGGMFYEFDPSNNAAEGTNTDFTVEGYQSVATTINNETWYVVVPQASSGETVKVAASTQDMATAIENASGNTTIYVTPNTTVQLPASISDKTLSFVGLDPETSHVYGNMAYWNAKNCNLSFENITIESFVNATNHTSMAFVDAASQTFKNVTFIGEFHVSTGTASFTDCTFDYDKTTGTNYALWCESDKTTNITNCTLNCNDGKAILVYAGQGAPDNCYGGDVNVNGLTVTSTGAPNDKAVIEIHSEKYIGAGTITILNVTYPSSYFKAGLWQEVNNTTFKGQHTHYYKVIVDGQTVQDGGATGTYQGNGEYSN